MTTDLFDTLESLDDPTPFTASPELLGAAVARGRQLRRRRRGGLAAGAIPVVLVLALVAGAVYVDRRSNDVARVDIAAGVLADPAAGAPYNILVVGVDGPQLGVPGAGERSDVMLVARVDRAAGRLSLLSVPRDLVFSPADPGAGRLDGVLATGGADGLVRTLQDHLGLDISHYVQIDFQGFERLIDASGGISVRASIPLRDQLSGMRLDASCQRLDGPQTLGLVRARHVEFESGGRWTADMSGDLGRVQRQQVVLSLLMTQLAAMPDDPATLDHLLDVFADNTTVDTGFSRTAILDLARWGHRLDPSSIVTATLPTVAVTLPSAGAALALAPGSAAALDAFQQGSTAAGSGDAATPAAPFTIAAC